jgi:peroxiredoxin
MGKISVIILVALMFAVTGCEAFKDYYDAPPTAALEGGAVPAENPPPAEGGSKLPDYTADKTECKSVEKISVSVIEGEDAVTNDGWTADVAEGKGATVLAEKQGDFTTTVTIAKDAETLTFTLKQVGEAAYSACDVLYQSCVDGNCVPEMPVWTDVSKGEIKIAKFNAKDGDAVVNSGSYDITFAKSTNSGYPGTTLAGSYFTDILGKAYEVK